MPDSKWQLTMEDKNLARRMWSAGKKEVEIRGIRFKMSKSVHNVAIHEKDTLVTRRQKEEWLILKPANGDLVPMASLELGNNSRVRTAAS